MAAGNRGKAGPKPPIGRRFEKGRSGNPNGRPKGFKGLAAEIDARTGGGKELVEIALAIARGEPYKPPGSRKRLSPKFRDRIEAVKWLADRGYGKALQAIELTGRDGEAIRVETKADLSKLTSDELRQIVAIYEAADARDRSE